MNLNKNEKVYAERNAETFRRGEVFRGVQAAGEAHRYRLWNMPELKTNFNIGFQF